MRTAELIDRLAQSNAPARGATPTLARAVAVGALVSAALMLSFLGIRPDYAEAVKTWSYWLKFAYPLALALVALRTAARLARPGTRANAGWELLPPAIVIAAALAQWTATPAAARLPLLMGHSSALCPWRILTLSLPLLIATFWAMRRLAPTKPALAGTFAGLFAGSMAAWIYSFACDETSAVFLAVWYTAGIALAALLGAVAGRWALRW